MRLWFSIASAAAPQQPLEMKSSDSMTRLICRRESIAAEIFVFHCVFDDLWTPAIVDGYWFLVLFCFCELISLFGFEHSTVWLRNGTESSNASPNMLSMHSLFFICSFFLLAKVLRYDKHCQNDLSNDFCDVFALICQLSLQHIEWTIEF